MESAVLLKEVKDAPSQFEKAGAMDIKARWELAARGFISCSSAAIDGGDITAHPAASTFHLSVVVTSKTKRSFSLIFSTRLW